MSRISIITALILFIMVIAILPGAMALSTDNVSSNTGFSLGPGTGGQGAYSVLSGKNASNNPSIAQPTAETGIDVTKPFWWAFAPVTLSLSTIFILLGGSMSLVAIVVYWEHSKRFRLNFERVGVVLPYVILLLGIAGIAGTIVLKMYSMLLLGLYLVGPMILAVVLILIYNKSK